MGKIIDGRMIAAQVCLGIRARAEALKLKGIQPKLAVILVGDNPASCSYVRMKGKKAMELGIAVEQKSFSADLGQNELIANIRELNADTSVHGILVQLPLPANMDARCVLSEISPQKDVDGLHPLNAGALMTGQKGFIPCTPKGIMKLIESTGVAIEGKKCAVVGRSGLVGKPVSMLMLNKNATVIMCHSHTKDLCLITRDADILISAAGVAGLIRGDMIKPGAVVIDVGQSRVDGAWKGDVLFEEAMEKTAYITPVPGGVGPMTIAMLMENTVEAAENTVD